MKKLHKICSFILCVTMILSVVPTMAFAAEPSVSEDATHFEISAEYLAEMGKSGLTEEDVKALVDISNKIINADSMLEVDKLLDEYYEITANTSLAVTTAESFYSYSGGTLELEYTGSLSPISNVIFTKVIYMPAEQVVFYQKAMNEEGFLDYLIDNFVDVGVTIISAEVAKKIATYLGISSSSISWLVGGSLGVTVWILSNLDKWDMEDAIDDSTTGKLKLEYFYMTSISYPYYQEFQNFEPWNSSYVDVPEDYDYTWYSGVFDY